MTMSLKVTTRLSAYNVQKGHTVALNQRFGLGAQPCPHVKTEMYDTQCPPEV